MRRIGFGLVAVGLGIWLTTQGPARADRMQDELRQLEGTWQLISAETDGTKADPERIKEVRVVIKGTTSTVYFGKDQVAHSDRFTIDPTATPKQVDDHPNGPGLDGKVIRGIYKIEGDLLHSCVNKINDERPKSFEAPKGSGLTYRVFRRAPADR